MSIIKKLYLIMAMVTILAAIANSAAYAAFNSLSVVDENGAAVTAYRWLLQEDTTHEVVPGVFNGFSSLGVSIHKSYAPPVAKGTQANLNHLYSSVNPAKRYFISILPDPGAAVRYSIGGTGIARGQASAKVIVDKNPIPTAQILVYAFQDNSPINATPDPPAEAGLAGFQVLVYDQLGLMSQDAFGNGLGTTYQKNPDGTFKLDADGAPIVLAMGNGIYTGANGEVLVKNLAPGKYGIRVVPPPGTDFVQTSTIEGTPSVDAWVMANEPPALNEFGLLFYHVFTGFVRPMNPVNIVPAPPLGTPLGTVSGQVVKAHSSRFSQMLIQPGEPMSGAWVGINNLSGNDEQIYAGPCDATGNFNISGLPPGTYQIAIWDENLDAIIAFYTFIIPADGSSVNMGQLISNQWFGNIEGTVFNDANGNGVNDGEAGIPMMNVNLRFRDGSLYQTTPTDMMGAYSFGEVFPFFKWLVMEADNARLKSTGATYVVDDGAHAGDVGISINPQNQFPTPYISDIATPQIGAGPRTELATNPTMREGFILYADQTLIADYGKQAYTDTENGGITGRINYATTRTENDPQFEVVDNWEPGIPGVVVELYQVTGHDINGLPIINPAPIASTVSEGWDTNMPTGCAGDDPRFMDCAETIDTWNQARPAPYDGFYSIQTLLDGVTPVPPGDYVVKVVPPAGYEVVKNGDQNVYIGDNYKPSLLSKGLNAVPPTYPPPCVGTNYTIPAVLNLDGVTPNPDTAHIGQTACLCDSKEVLVTPGANTAADFHLFTEVPLAARGVGLITNDILTQANPNNPGFGEKLGPVWLPISFKDYLGNEITRTYSDQFGKYNALLPSTYTINPPIPTGVSPNMIQVVLNDKGADPAHPDPFYDPTYTTVSYTLDFWPGKITYLDTPVLPISASQTVHNLDCELAADSPVISQVNGPAGGPVITALPSTVTITSVGDVTVPNPAFDPTLFPPDGTPATITRHYGFGITPGTVSVGGVALPIVSWNDATIVATVPVGKKTGQLAVIRADGVSTKVGVYLRIKPGVPIRRVAPGGSIQAAIDASSQGTIILVPPAPTAAGYTENLIIWKRVKLQGYGAGSTLINAGTFTLADELAWTKKVNSRIKAGNIRLVPGQRLDLGLDKGAGITIFGRPSAATTANLYMIDGFTISGALRGGGINVNGYVQNLVISNNVIKGNEGSFGGGIRLGTPSLVNATKTGFVSNANKNINIHNNMIIGNGGVDGGGGLAIFNGADNYVVESNSVCGNFALVYGGGIAHVGLSNNGRIYNNEIKFNQAFDEGGGIMVAGELVPAGAPVGTLTPGAGNVNIDRNLVLSNIAGNDGGGIRTLLYNGQDVAANPTNAPQTLVNGRLVGPPQWHHLDLYNNMIVNNVTADAGGGVSLDNSASVNMVHNTIAYNDSTATAVDAFGANSQVSTPQISGVQSTMHNLGLVAAFDPSVLQTFSDPVMWNNVIFNNRSWYWDFTANPADRPTGFMIPRGFTPGQPDTASDPTLQYWDLGILGATAGEALHPNYCDLTNTTENLLFAGSNNIYSDPLFVSTYLNTIIGANAGGPAGNLITLTLVAQPPNLYNYHLGVGSPAIDAGSPSLPIGSGWPALLDEDFDGELRPKPGNNLPDIGADEKY